MSSPVATISCAKCGAEAARFQALRAGEGGGLLVGRERLERSGWMGTCSLPRPFADAAAAIDGIRQGPLGVLAAADPDLFSFFCRNCQAPYCQSCWTVGVPEFDDGFYDCTRGTCPRGHGQVLDD